MKTALICGVSGQDGAYLARWLLSKGYRVYGGSRDAQASSFANLHRLGIVQDVQTLSLSLKDFRNVLQVLEQVQPDEVYNLSGQSSVALSFEQPIETLESITVGTTHLLEAVRLMGAGDGSIRFYNAGSSECFGDHGQAAVDETSAFRPRSPYAAAKAAAHWLVANYREAYGLYACTGILFNHESPLRPPRFVTKKIVSAAARIAGGSKERLVLGNLGIIRDWGWAPEYVEAMWLLLQQDRPDDFVIATGQSFPLRAFVAQAFSLLDLAWEEWVEVDERLFRPLDLLQGYASPQKAARLLSWSARSAMPQVVSLMLAGERHEAG